MRNTITETTLVALLLMGCATEPPRQPSSGAVPPGPGSPNATPPTVPIEGVEAARRHEEEAERPPELPTIPGDDGIEEVHFASGTADLSTTARARLDRVSSALRDAGSNFYIALQGHADATGEETANLELAEHRALVVREYLHSTHGIPVDRMGVIPLGSAAPVAEDSTPHGRQQNRRVVLVVVLPPD